MISRSTISSRAGFWLLAVCASAALAACSGYKPPKPTPLQENPAAVSVQSGWSSRLPAGVDFPLQVPVNGTQIVVADDKGTVQAMQADTGAVLWQVNIGSNIAAGVGSDGQTAAVVTSKNELVAVRDGKEQWRAPLAAQAYTAPLVAGGRVFVMTSDRAIAAYDAGNGFRLWNQKSRTFEEKLVLRQNALLTAAGGALLAGVSGRVVVFNPDNGLPLMQAEVASPRGATEVARMADVLGPASRLGGSLCARTYQAGVGCILLQPGNNQSWSKLSIGTQGVSGDAQIVVGSDDEGDVVAWSRANGEPVWTNKTLRYRGLSAPLVVGSHVLVGDAQGYVHVLAHDTGALRNRVATEGGAIQVAPVLAGQTAVVVGKSGLVTGVRLP